MAKVSGSAAFGGDVGEQRYSEMWDRYKQHLAWVLVALIVIGGAAWFYFRSAALKEQHAETAYETGLQSVQSGNIPLAESDLRKASTRYAGTNGGAEASMALAKLYYQQGKYQQGIDALTDAARKKGDLQYAAGILRGVGYEGLSKWDAAAQQYDQAARAARFPADANSAKAMEARAYQSGGNKAAAIKIWNDLLSDAKSGFTAEAEVRLGELEAQPEKV